MLKPQTVPVLLLALLVGRRYRALASFTGVVGAVVVAIVPVLGWRWPLQFLAFLVRFAQSPPSVGNPGLDQGWSGLFLRLLGAGLPDRLATTLAIALSLALVAWAWLRARGSDTAGSKAQERWELRWAFTMIVAILVDPHVLPHDLTLLIVPAIILASSPPRSTYGWNAWLWLGWLLGIMAELYRGPLPPLSPLWLAASAAWLFWSLQGNRPIGSGWPLGTEARQASNP